MRKSKRIKIERFGIEEKKKSDWKNFKTFVILLIIGLIIYIFVHKFINLIKPLFRDNLIPTWINLGVTIFGTIITVFFTYIGVRSTIKYNKKSEAKQSRLECIPFLNIELNELFNDKSDLNLLEQETIYEIKNKNSKNNIKPEKTVYLKLKVSNIGKGFANTTVIKTGENFGGIKYKKMILKNGSTELYLKINIYDESIEEYERNFEIEYIDSKTNEYNQLYSIKFKNQNFKNVDIDNGYPKFLQKVHEI